MGNAPDRVRALEHAANLVVLLHARLDALDAALPVSAPALRRLVAQVAELARCVERLDDAGPKEEHDDWTFNRSGLVARDLWHAAAEFDFTPAQAEEHVAGLLYGLAELARTLGDELGDVTLTDAATLPACIASLTDALVLLHTADIADADAFRGDADAYLTPVSRRLLSLDDDGLGLWGRDTRRAVLDLIAARRGVAGLTLDDTDKPGDLIVAAAVVLGHLHALQALVTAGGPAPLIFTPPAQETPDAPAV